MKNLTLFGEMDELFKSFGLRPHDSPTDLRENENGFEIEVDLPGVDPKDIDISTENGKLSIKAERKWLKFKRSYSESFSLPSSVDVDAITAIYKQGVLAVTIPKKSTPQSKKIVVKIE